MNLGKLLGAGKSFFGGGGGVAYRENKRIYLPKFNAEKNPFLPKPAEPVVVAPAPKIPAPVAGQTPKMVVPAAAQPVRTKSWTDKLNPFRAAEPVAPKAVNAVQVELSLDAVKVIHNDLADADIEVVPVKSNTITAVETPLLPPARPSWEFLGGRLTAR